MTNGKNTWVRFEIRPEDMEVVKIDLVPPGEIESATFPAGCVTVKITPPAPAIVPEHPAVILARAEVFADPDHGISCADWALPNSAGRLVQTFAEEAVRAAHADWVAAAMAKAQAFDEESGEDDLGSEAIEVVGVTD